jgi:hypothetical protein
MFNEGVAERRQPSAPMDEAEWSQHVDHLVDIGAGERPRVRVSRDELTKDWLDQIGPRPLQEHLGDEHGVRIAALAPWKRSTRAAKPRQNTPPNPA